MSILSRLIDRRIAVFQEDLIGTHYAEVDNMYRQTRGWRHDFRNHIQVMKTLAASGDLTALTSYLDELEADLLVVDTVLKTGNKMTDAILNSKISLARDKKISVVADAEVAVEITVAPLDLCIIIGNLMDNAIEACAALPETGRFIRIFVETKGNQLYISVTNSSAGRRVRNGARFASTKGNGHGFGLVRIDDAVTRYGGFVSRNSEDGAFTTEVLLPCRG